MSLENLESHLFLVYKLSSTCKVQIFGKQNNSLGHIINIWTYSKGY